MKFPQRVTGIHKTNGLSSIMPQTLLVALVAVDTGMDLVTARPVLDRRIPVNRTPGPPVALVVQDLDTGTVSANRQIPVYRTLLVARTDPMPGTDGPEAI